MAENIDRYSYSEIATIAGCSTHSVARIVKSFGLTRKPDAEREIRSRIRKEMLRSERRRLEVGKEPVTGVRARIYQPIINQTMFIKIFIIMVILLAIYYAVVIAMDLYKAKLGEENEQSTDEVEIDISDAASGFQPIEILKDDQQKAPQKDENIHEGSDGNIVEDLNDEPEALYEQGQVPEEEYETLASTLGQIPDDVRSEYSEKEENEPSEGTEKTKSRRDPRRTFRPTGRDAGPETAHLRRWRRSRCSGLSD